MGWGPKATGVGLVLARSLRVHSEPLFMGACWKPRVIGVTWGHGSQLKVGWVGRLGLWDLACWCRPGAGVHGEIGCSLFSASPTRRCLFSFKLPRLREGKGDRSNVKLSFPFSSSFLISVLYSGAVPLYLNFYLL